MHRSVAGYSLNFQYSRLPLTVSAALGCIVQSIAGKSSFAYVRHVPPWHSCALARAWSQTRFVRRQQESSLELPSAGSCLLPGKWWAPASHPLKAPFSIRKDSWRVLSIPGIFLSLRKPTCWIFTCVFPALDVSACLRPSHKVLCSSGSCYCFYWKYCYLDKSPLLFRWEYADKYKQFVSHHVQQLQTWWLWFGDSSPRFLKKTRQD